jgi:mannose-6-phosphate isomerase-like protein (cupin superfamily)
VTGRKILDSDRKGLMVATGQQDTSSLGKSVGLCAACAHVHVIRSDRGSLFYLCTLSASDPRYAKYPMLPVLSCAGYAECAISRNFMPDLIEKPTIIEAAGNLPKRIAEFVGRVNSKTEAVSIARMESPQGWIEPGQTPEFDEYTVVLRGTLRVETRSGAVDVKAGQAIAAHRGGWVRYSTPEPGGAEYIAVCIPAFAPELVHRERA